MRWAGQQQSAPGRRLWAGPAPGRPLGVASGLGHDALQPVPARRRLRQRPPARIWRIDRGRSDGRRLHQRGGARHEHGGMDSPVGPDSVARGPNEKVQACGGGGGTVRVYVRGAQGERAAGRPAGGGRYQPGIRESGNDFRSGGGVVEGVARNCAQQV